MKHKLLSALVISLMASPILAQEPLALFKVLPTSAAAQKSIGVTALKTLDVDSMLFKSTNRLIFTVNNPVSHFINQVQKP